MRVPVDRLAPGRLRALGTGDRYTLTPADAATRVFCLVDASSAAGTSTSMAAVSAPGGPTRSTPFATMSLPPMSPLPAPGTVVTCKPPTYREPA